MHDDDDDDGDDDDDNDGNNDYDGDNNYFGAPSSPLMQRMEALLELNVSPEQTKQLLTPSPKPEEVPTRLRKKVQASATGSILEMAEKPLKEKTSQELRMLSPSLFIQGLQCKC